MKNVCKYPLLYLSLIVIISSCGVQKRLHNPGYYVQLNKNYKTEKVTENLTKATKEVKSLEVETTVATVTPVEQRKVNTSIIASSNEVAMNNTANVLDLASTDESMTFPPTSKKNLIQESYTSVKQPIIQPAKFKTTHSKKAWRTITDSTAPASGGAIVLFVILCFFPFINLIPVYLTDGAVTMNFWLTLILDLLTVVGGIIFALLVVLGVVSIA